MMLLLYLILACVYRLRFAIDGGPVVVFVGSVLLLVLSLLCLFVVVCLCFGRPFRCLWYLCSITVLRFVVAGGLGVIFLVCVLLVMALLLLLISVCSYCFFGVVDGDLVAFVSV